MYRKNITAAMLALLNKEASPQKVKQSKRDKLFRPSITKAKIHQLRRLFRYQLAAIDGKIKRAF